MSRLLYSALAFVICGSIFGCGKTSTAPGNSAPMIQSPGSSDQGSDSKDASQSEKKSSGSDSR
jgi:hypothetical protein